MATSTKDMTECKVEAGRFVPQINRERCEGKTDCVAACPYDVFEMQKLDKSERDALSLVGRLKLMVHGGEQAFAVRVEECRACGLCVKACPEKAIKLIKVGV